MNPFRSITQLVSLSLVGALTVTVPGCNGGSSTGNDRWVTTENSTVELDWDEVAKAYKEAEGPEDLERRVNEIYTGDEIISVSVHDVDEKTQMVTGFFDKNENGSVEDGEKVFSIQRDLKSADQAQYQIQGHGPYAGYHSPMWDIAAGMVMGSMISRMFMPGYSPVYTRPYVTPPSRHSALASSRNAYRQANPSKFNSGSRSQSGKAYGKKGGGFGGGSAPRAPMRRSGGGRFGRRGTDGSRAAIRLS